MGARSQAKPLHTHPLPTGNPAELQDSADHHTFKKMLPRDERRFKAADLDGDLTATREEFTAFLHPEEFEHMKEIVVLVRIMERMGRKLSTSLALSFGWRKLGCRLSLCAGS